MCQSVEIYLPRLAARAAEERVRDWVPAAAPGPEPARDAEARAAGHGTGGLLARILALLHRKRVEEGAAALPAE